MSDGRPKAYLVPEGWRAPDGYPQRAMLALTVTSNPKLDLSESLYFRPVYVAAQTHGDLQEFLLEMVKKGVEALIQSDNEPGQVHEVSVTDG